MSLEILNRFSANLKQILTKSINLALAQRSPEITPFILFTALLQHRGCLASNLLYKFKVSPKDIAPPPPLGPTPVNFLPQFSSDSKKVIERASILAQQLKHQYIGSEHLLQALINLNDPKISVFLKRKNVSLNDLNKKIDLLLKNTSGLPQITSFFKDEEDLDEDEDQASALEFFGTNLTNPENQLDIDPVIGRSQEIERLIHIISRRTKNNPVLIGEPGVGKTAIAEGLAKRILEKNVPEVLLDKQIYKLDLSLIVAGTMYRGEFESRFKQIIEELQDNPDIIVFIDEIHTLMGTGSSGPGGGTMDAANILKPALAKGQIRCIGATTSSEYRKHIESDPALERRFQSILVEEPSSEETLEILKGIKENYEHYHQVNITPEALKAAVDLSVRYVQDKFLPDKAIDLIDEAAAKSRVDRPLSPTVNLIKQLDQKISNLKQKKLSLIKAEKLSEALDLKEKEQELLKQIKELRKQPKLKKYSTKIQEQDIAAIISKITGLPLGELINSEKSKVLNLEKKLSQSILGQPQATTEITNLIKRSRAGLSSPNRPLGSFIFLGPSGVGKTELAKVLAQSLFGDEKSFLRLDMSEFKEGFNASKLIGAPAGYIGYKEGAKLTDFVKQRPHSVILFDEIEKAHPDIFNLFLQILEDGHLTDATGKKVNFKNTLIIMTSNIGLQNFLQQAQIGFDNQEQVKELDYEKIKDHVLGELKKQFRPEFLNRIDKTIVFNPLTLDLVTKIAELQTKELSELLKEQKINLKIDKSVYKHLAEKSFSPEEGARALRKIIQEQLATPLAEKILSEDIKPGSAVNITLEKNKLTITS